MSPPRARLLRHPGPVQAERITARAAPATATFRLALAPGARLDEAIVTPLAAVGVRDAVLTLLSGPWAELAYCTGIPDPSGVRLATYAEPVRVTDALVVGGSATLGRDPEGAPLVHAHAAFVDAAGALRGGHLVPDACRTGDGPTTAFVTMLAGIAVVQAADAETNHRLFRPVEAREVPHG